MNPETFDIQTFVQQVAEAMGSDWKAYHPEDNMWRTDMRRRDDQTYTIWFFESNLAPKGMIRISGSMEYYHGPGNGLAFGEHVASINVSQQKTPQQVAKEIQRRLLPTYTDQHARNQAYIAEQQAYETARDATAEALNAMERAYKQAHSSGANGYWLRLETYGKDKAKLSVDNLPLNLVQRILDLLNEGDHHADH